MTGGMIHSNLIRSVYHRLALKPIRRIPGQMLINCTFERLETACRFSSPMSELPHVADTSFANRREIDGGEPTIRYQRRDCPTQTSSRHHTNVKVIHDQFQIPGKECHASPPPVASRATDRHGTAKTTGPRRGDPPTKSVRSTSNINPGRPASSYGHRPAAVRRDPETMDISLKHPVPGSTTISKCHRNHSPQNSRIRLISNPEKGKPCNIVALPTQPVAIAVCILLTTFNAAALVFLVDCMYEDELSPFILFSLVPMTWTLTKIWREARKDLVLVSIAATTLDIEREAEQRSEHV